MSRTLRIALLLLMLGLRTALAAEAPHTFSLSANGLVAARTQLAKGDARLATPLAQLKAEADKLLSLKPASVMDKNRTAISGDRHDYFSLAPYWWPDPTKPNGRPYIRHDGERNPEIRNGTDYEALGRSCNAVETLGLAFWFTGDERYAQKAAILIRVWFLDPATRMNPNLEHAQAIPGINDGRGIGIIEAHYLIGLLDGLALIAGSPAWPADAASAMQAWLSDYYLWLTTSKNGTDESGEKNNHGSWYDAHVADLALVLDRKDDAKKILAAFAAKRIAPQIEPDGRQPLELARTKSLNYSIFNLEALFMLCRLGEQVGVDGWNFATADGRSVRKALLYIAPYVDPAKTWPKDDIEAADRKRILPLLAMASDHYSDPLFRSLFEKFSGQPETGEHWRLCRPGQP